MFHVLLSHTNGLYGRYFSTEVCNTFFSSVLCPALHIFLPWLHRNTNVRWSCNFRISTLYNFLHFIASTCKTPVSSLLKNSRSWYIYIYIYICVCGGVGSSVSLATDYRLDGPGSNPGENEIFRPSRPTLAPTQPPLQWVPGLSWE